MLELGGGRGRGVEDEVVEAEGALGLGRFEVEAEIAVVEAEGALGLEEIEVEVEEEVFTAVS